MTTLPFSAAHAGLRSPSPGRRRPRRRSSAASSASAVCPAPASSTTTPPSSRRARGGRAQARSTSSPPCWAPSRWALVLRPAAPEARAGGADDRVPRDLFLPLRDLLSLDDLQAQTTPGPTTRLRRHLRRLGARVVEALAVERADLAAAARSPRRTDRHLEARASRDGFVRVCGVDYSVPPGFAAADRGRAPLAADSRSSARDPRSPPPAQLRARRRRARPGAWPPWPSARRGARAAARRRARAAGGRPDPLRRPLGVPA